MNANKLMNNARKAEREGNDERAEELYKTIIETFPDTTAAKDAKLDLNDLLIRKGKPALTTLTQPKADKVQTVKTKTVESVIVVDIKMPFWSMVTFMVKAAIAAIPAFIIIILISALIFTIFIGLFGDMTR